MEYDCSAFIESPPSKCGRKAEQKAKAGAMRGDVQAGLLSTFAKVLQGCLGLWNAWSHSIFFHWLIRVGPASLQTPGLCSPTASPATATSTATCGWRIGLGRSSLGLRGRSGRPEMKRYTRRGRSRGAAGA